MIGYPLHIYKKDKDNKRTITLLLDIVRGKQKKKRITGRAIK